MFEMEEEEEVGRNQRTTTRLLTDAAAAKSALARLLSPSKFSFRSHNCCRKPLLGRIERLDLQAEERKRLAKIAGSYLYKAAGPLKSPLIKTWQTKQFVKFIRENGPDDSDGLLGCHSSLDHKESSDDRCAARNSGVTVDQHRSCPKIKLFFHDRLAING